MYVTGEKHDRADARRSEKPFSAGVFVHADSGGEADLHTRLFWRPDWDASVVAIDAEPVPRTHPDAFSLALFPGAAHILLDKKGNQVALLSDGCRHLQLAVEAGSLIDGAVRLHYRLSGISDIEVKLNTLRRLAMIQRLGRYPASMFPPEPATAKWSLALQAYDGHSAGARLRDVAVALFGERLVRDEWRGRSDFLRLRVQRAVAYGRKMVNGGFRALLQ